MGPAHPRSPQHQPEVNDTVRFILAAERLDAGLAARHDADARKLLASTRQAGTVDGWLTSWERQVLERPPLASTLLPQAPDTARPASGDRLLPRDLKAARRLLAARDALHALGFQTSNPAEHTAARATSSGQLANQVASAARAMMDCPPWLGDVANDTDTQLAAQRRTRDHTGQQLRQARAWLRQHTGPARWLSARGRRQHLTLRDEAGQLAGRYHRQAEQTANLAARSQVIAARQHERRQWERDNQALLSRGAAARLELRDRARQREQADRGRQQRGAEAFERLNPDADRGLNPIATRTQERWRSLGHRAMAASEQENSGPHPDRQRYVADRARAAAAETDVRRSLRDAHTALDQLHTTTPRSRPSPARPAPER